jgi:hypothetical protein
VTQGPYHHANLIPVSTIDLHCVVEHQVHELIKPAQHANYVPACVQLDCKIQMKALVRRKNLFYTPALQYSKHISKTKIKTTPNSSKQQANHKP